MAYRLALRCGEYNVEDPGGMLEKMSARQFMGWEEYAALEPFDERRADYRAASIVQVIANVNRSKKQQAYKLDDFLLKFGDAEEPKKTKQTWQEQKSMAYMIAMAFSVDAQEVK